MPGVTLSIPFQWIEQHVLFSVFLFGGPYPQILSIYSWLWSLVFRYLECIVAVLESNQTIYDGCLWCSSRLLEDK